MANQQRTPLQLVQHDPAELERAKQLSPVEFFNKYVREEGEKVLTQAEYDNYTKEIARLRKSDGTTFRQAMYPAMPDETFPATLKDFEAARPKEDLNIKNKIVVYGTKDDTDRQE